MVEPQQGCPPLLFSASEGENLPEGTVPVLIGTIQARPINEENIVGLKCYDQLGEFFWQLLDFGCKPDRTSKSSPHVEHSCMSILLCLSHTIVTLLQSLEQVRKRKIVQKNWLPSDVDRIAVRVCCRIGFLMPDGHHSIPPHKLEFPATGDHQRISIHAVHHRTRYRCCLPHIAHATLQTTPRGTDPAP